NEAFFPRLRSDLRRQEKEGHARQSQKGGQETQASQEKAQEVKRGQADVNQFITSSVNIGRDAVASSSSGSDVSDEELLAQFRQGVGEAFGVLVRRYEGELYGYLRRYLGDRDLADDVFQNTFLQLYTKIHQYETGRPVRPWLYAIATNQAIDALRRQNRH